MSEEYEFSEMVAAQSRDLLRFGFFLTGDWPLSEDLVQASLEATWRHWAAVERRDAPELYVRQVMVRTWLRWRRRRWTLELPGQRVPDQPDRHDSIAIAETRLIVLRALDSLSPRQRAVLILRHFEDRSEQETAAALGCSVGAAKKHAARALTKLRALPSIAALTTERSPSS